MKMKKILILLLIVIFISGCVSSPVLKVQSQDIGELDDGEDLAKDNFCMDNNHNGVCDDKEVPSIVTPTEESIKEDTGYVIGEQNNPLDSRFLEVLDNQKRVKSYSYIKKLYSDGLGSIIIKDKSDITKKGILMKQLIANKIYYQDDEAVYHYVYSDNASYIVNENILKEDTLLSEFNNVENLVIEKETQTINSMESMVIRYDIGENSYKAAIWKYYGVPIIIEINNDENDGQIIRYSDVNINHVTTEEVTRPDSEII